MSLGMSSLFSPNRITTQDWMRLSRDVGRLSFDQILLANGGTLSQVLEIFVNPTSPFIRSLNGTIVYWEHVSLDDIVSVDRSSSHKSIPSCRLGRMALTIPTKRIVSLGYRTIVSSSEYYYLVCGHGDFLENNSLYDDEPADGEYKDEGSWCGPFKTWRIVFDYDITFGLTKEEAKLVLVGEVTLWSEQEDLTVLDAGIWPRASAMA